MICYFLHEGASRLDGRTYFIWLTNIFEVAIRLQTVRKNQRFFTVYDTAFIRRKLSLIIDGPRPSIVALQRIGNKLGHQHGYK